MHICHTNHTGKQDFGRIEINEALVEREKSETYDMSE